MTSKPATNAAEYLEATRDSNKQRELHPADLGSIDLGAFQLMSRDGQRAAWLIASDADKRGLALQIIRSRNVGPDEATIALYLDLCEDKFGSDQTIPSAAELIAACADRAAGPQAARYARLARQLDAGARLAWSGGALVVASPSGNLYHVSEAGCDCLNSRAARPSCWHLVAHGLLLDLLDERAATADMAVVRAELDAEPADDPYAPMGPCAVCGADAWTTTAHGLRCETHDLDTELPPDRVERGQIHTTLATPPRRVSTDHRRAGAARSVSIPSRYVICTPDHNWYGPYADEEAARYVLDVLRGRYGWTIAQRQGTDWMERRPLKVATARYTSAGIAIDWPDWRKK